MENLEFIKESIKRFLIPILIVIFFFISLTHRSVKLEAQNKTNYDQTCTWEICSIDTMKTSRDLAREKLYDRSYDTEIRKTVDLVKETGANYIAIDTPYDNEFIPYLKRWVDIARSADLKIWFRGNWSSWEGWFDYPKNLTPEEHIKKTNNFIISNPDLFRDGDIFDACPECENAGHWPQPEKNEEYNLFIQKQKKSLDNAFNKINKKVKTNIASIIGGRAKEVLYQDTYDVLNNVVSIDHYFKDPNNITEYLNYFSNSKKSKVVLSEFGAPIPDINGYMSDEDQANYIDNVLNNIYKSHYRVLGVNYWALSNGTTELVNLDKSKKPAYEVITRYFSPGIITGKITDEFGSPLKGVVVMTNDGIGLGTDEGGKYLIQVPKRRVILEVGGWGDYTKMAKAVEVKENGEKITANFILKPLKPSLEYRFKIFINNIITGNPW